MPCLVIGDDDVRRLDAAAAVARMKDAVVAAHQRQLMAPPRVRATLGERDYVFTVGGLRGGVNGFRAYRTGDRAGDQLVAVWDARGRLKGVVVGEELGARRTGALGAVAADALAGPQASTVGVIGSGTQAWTQLWAVNAVRRIEHTRVYSPDEAHRRAFAAAAAREFHIDVSAVDSAHDAVCGHAIVILATRSRQPVIDAADVSPGAHVVTVGPKSVVAHETPLELIDRASIITCDSANQAAAYPEAFFTGERELVDLGAVILGEHPGRTAASDITVHCSVGLAGTEVLLADLLIARQPGADEST